LQQPKALALVHTQQLSRRQQNRQLLQSFEAFGELKRWVQIHLFLLLVPIALCVKSKRRNDEQNCNSKAVLSKQLARKILAGFHTKRHRS
jgi:hypothetical protein